MTETVVNIWSHGVSGVQNFAQGASQSIERLKVSAPSRDIIILGCILSVLQVLDGVLTGVGIYHFGTTAEGNFILKYLMDAFGYTTALVAVKTVALAVIFVLCSLASMVTWLRSAMIAVIFIYLGAAIIPWTFIIATHVL